MAFSDWFRRYWTPTNALLLALALIAVGSLDWRTHAPPGLPKVAVELHASGDLRAGAVKVSIDPPFAVPMASMGAREIHESTGVFQPAFARALVLEVGGKRLAMVSVELAVLPGSLRAKVLAAVADLHLSDLLIGATHTHTGAGGFVEGPLADLYHVGEYDPRVSEFLVRQIADALHRAAVALGPARIGSAAIEASKFALSLETPPGKVDSTLTGARVYSADGRPIANIVVFAADPTIVLPTETRLTGDWPGAMMAALEADDGPPTLFFQGAVGDTTWGKREGNISFEDRPARFGQAVAADAKGALAAAGKGDASVSLDFAREEIALPPCEALGKLPLFGRIQSNWFCWQSGLNRASQTTSVSYLHLGSLRLASAPGVMVAALGLAWKEPLKDATIVSLMDDYVGSIATPSSIESEAETPSIWDTYFGVELAPVVLQGLELAREKASSTQPRTGN